MILEEIPRLRSGRIKASYKILCKCEDCSIEFRRPVKAAIVSSVRCKSCTTTHMNLTRDPSIHAKMIAAAADVWRGRKRSDVMGDERAELERQAQSARNSGQNNPNYGGKYSRGFADRPIIGSLEDNYGIDKAKEMRKMFSERTSGQNNPMYGKPTPERSGNGISGWYQDKLYFRSLLELAFILKCEITAKKIQSAERKEYRFPYVLDGVERTYTPDFVDEDGVLYEVKPTSLAKSRLVQVKLQASKCVKLVTEDELQRPTKPELLELIRAGVVRIDNSKMWRIE